LPVAVGNVPPGPATQTAEMITSVLSAGTWMWMPYTPNPPPANANCSFKVILTNDPSGPNDNTVFGGAAMFCCTLPLIFNAAIDESPTNAGVAPVDSVACATTASAATVKDPTDTVTAAVDARASTWGAPVLIVTAPDSTRASAVGLAWTATTLVCTVAGAGPDALASAIVN
jgi:hypothetical protein